MKCLISLRVAVSTAARRYACFFYALHFIICVFSHLIDFVCVCFFFLLSHFISNIFCLLAGFGELGDHRAGPVWPAVHQPGRHQEGGLLAKPEEQDLWWDHHRIFPRSQTEAEGQVLCGASSHPTGTDKVSWRLNTYMAASFLWVSRSINLWF